MRHPSSTVTAQAPAKKAMPKTTASAAPAGTTARTPAGTPRQPARRQSVPDQGGEVPARTRQPETTLRAPEPEPKPQPEPQPQPDKPDNTMGDTTRTGIIKNFLRQMGGDNAPQSTDELALRKNQFQEFFEESVAVVPDANGKLPPERKSGKKRGLFKRAEDTAEITPIRVSVFGDKDAVPEDGGEETGRQRSRKKKGFFGLFGGRSEEPEDEEETVFEPEEEENPPEEDVFEPDQDDALPGEASEPEYDAENGSEYGAGNGSEDGRRGILWSSRQNWGCLPVAESHGDHGKGTSSGGGADAMGLPAV